MSYILVGRSPSNPSGPSMYCCWLPTRVNPGVGASYWLSLILNNGPSSDDHASSMKLSSAKAALFTLPSIGSTTEFRPPRIMAVVRIVSQVDWLVLIDGL